MNITQNLINNFTGYNVPAVDVGIYYGSVCNQLNHYFIKIGITLIVLYLFICWFNWWFFNYGYKKISYNKLDKFGKFVGDLNILETRIYWDIWIKTRLMKLLIGYIVVVVYLNVRG